MDSNKYVNTYLDFAVGMIHEATNDKLQLRTQIKLANDLVAERDQVISSLKTQIEEMQKQSQQELKVEVELSEEKKKSKRWEDSYHALNNKVAHFDNLTNQFNDIKSQFQMKSQEVQRLNVELEEVKRSFITEKSQLEQKTADLNNEKVQLEQKINNLNAENEKLLLKISSLEAVKKQINTSTKKKTNTILPLQETAKLETIENNDF